MIIARDYQWAQSRISIGLVEHGCSPSMINHSLVSLKDHLTPSLSDRVSFAGQVPTTFLSPMGDRIGAKPPERFLLLGWRSYLHASMRAIWRSLERFVLLLAGGPKDTADTAEVAKGGADSTRPAIFRVGNNRHNPWELKGQFAPADRKVSEFQQISSGLDLAVRWKLLTQMPSRRRRPPRAGWLPFDCHPVWSWGAPMRVQVGAGRLFFDVDGAKLVPDRGHHARAANAAPAPWWAGVRPFGRLQAELLPTHRERATNLP